MLYLCDCFSGCLACSEAGLTNLTHPAMRSGRISGDCRRHRSSGTDKGLPQYTDMGASSADTDAPRMAITIPIPPTLAADTATTVCAYLQRCNYTEIAEEVLNEPCQQVIERQMEDAVVNRLSPLQELGMLSFNPQGNRACLSAIEALPCSLDFTSLSQACEDGFDGLLEEALLSMKPVWAMRTVPGKRVSWALPNTERDRPGLPGRRWMRCGDHVRSWRLPRTLSPQWGMWR